MDAEESESLLERGSTGEKPRNLAAFWLLGLTNNYAYVVMLSAAGDLLGEGKSAGAGGTCARASAAAILMADILPALLIKLCGPFLNMNAHVGVSIVVFLSSLSFVMTSFVASKWITFGGVIAASIGSGLGEITFLRYSTKFHKNVVSTWSSGTGAAGVLGSFAYAAIAMVLKPDATLRVMLVVPILMAVTFWVILEHPKPSRRSRNYDDKQDEEEGVGSSAESSVTLTLADKLRLTKPLLKYMVPLGLVYFAEYFINQGLTELITFENAGIAVGEQYRWYQVSYQVGVFISRSSVNFVHIEQLWLLSVLQIFNAVVFTFEALYRFLPSFWIMVFVILYEGLLGGASYVNTFYKVSKEVEPRYREFSMGVTSLADSVGITLSAFVAILAHNLICEYRGQ